MHHAGVCVRRAAEAGCVEGVSREIPHESDPTETEISLQENGVQPLAPRTRDSRTAKIACPTELRERQEARPRLAVLPTCLLARKRDSALARQCAFPVCGPCCQS